MISTSNSLLGSLRTKYTPFNSLLMGTAYSEVSAQITARDFNLTRKTGNLASRCKNTPADRLHGSHTISARFILLSDD